jgi:LPS-assembly protein
MNEDDFTLARTEVEAQANFDRWSTSVIYGNYAAQPPWASWTARRRCRKRQIQG